MADYREISQEYARGGIGAAFLVNSGAAVALLSQAADLISAGLASDLATAVYWWAFGTISASVTWIVAFLSTRYVDKSDREASLQGEHLRTSDRYMIVGILLTALSLCCFAAGCVSMAIALKLPIAAAASPAMVRLNDANVLS